MRALAAGSLRRVWPQLMAHFPEPVETQFGPAGLLRERIESGEACDLFASANLAHPQALLAAGRAQSVAVRKRALALVGGRSSAPVPAGRLAAEWIIQGGQAEVFIGYASYAARLRELAGLTVIDIPEPFNPRAEYGCAVMSAQGQRLANFLQSDRAKAILQNEGFLPGGAALTRPTKANP